MYYMGFTYTEAYTVPIWQRHWFIKRINKEIKDASDQGSNGSRAAHHNTPGTRTLMGRNRSHTPSRVRRFT